jgi:DNA-directed RNA polymerase subunit K/omega
MAESIVRPRISKYEYTKIIGIRTEMLARGSPPLIELSEEHKRRGIYDIQLIAEAEYERGVLPFDIIRQRGTSSRIRLYDVDA